MSQPLVKCARKYKVDLCQLNVQCHGILTCGFFHESVSPKPLNILLGPFQIFFKFVEVFAAQGAPNGKNFQSEKF
jgi:hypothetical protein